MTAEIAIANRSAVALATDSKVTLSGANGRQKTYDTVDKLFSLSKTEPVGAMIYGNAEFMGFPWETIIKTYRRKEPRKRFDTIFDWADDLKKYLTSFFAFTGEDEGGVLQRMTTAAISQLSNNVLGNLDGNATPDQIKQQLSDELEEHIAELGPAQDFFTADEWAAIAAAHQDLITRIATSGAARVMPEDRVRVLIELLVRKAAPSLSSSGLVVAGFGEKELLPSIISFEIDGIIGGRLKLLETNRFDATRRSSTIIMPFAQTDMVYRFMEGIDPTFEVQLLNAVGGIIRKTAVDTASVLGKSEDEIAGMSDALNAATTAAMDAFQKSTSVFRKRQFADPITQMTGSLPKDELANLAESLVSLTSLQRRVSRELETVGGAIDVAVISKGDGFVWIKRKHYFKADRNLRFVSSYFSEFGADQPNPGDDQ